MKINTHQNPSIALLLREVGKEDTDNHRKQRARHKEPTQDICRNTNRKRRAGVSETSLNHLHIKMTSIAYSGEAGILQVMFLGTFPGTAGWWYWGKFHMPRTCTKFTEWTVQSTDSSIQGHNLRRRVLSVLWQKAFQALKLIATLLTSEKAMFNQTPAQLFPMMLYWKFSRTGPHSYSSCTSHTLLTSNTTVRQTSVQDKHNLQDHCLNKQ